jgi:hypothetical protein
MVIEFKLITNISVRSVRIEAVVGGLQSLCSQEYKKILYEIILHVVTYTRELRSLFVVIYVLMLIVMGRLSDFNFLNICRSMHAAVGY